MVLRTVRDRRGISIRLAAVAALSVIVVPSQRLAAQDAASESMPATHIVKRGDTLWDIAHAYLGDPFQWPEIYRINTDLIEDPHWIYPGEVLKLPGAQAKVVAVTPPVNEAPMRPAATSTLLTPVQSDRPVLDQTTPEPPHSAVRMGEYLASPWVDQRGGPPGSGYILQAVDLPGIASADHSRMNLYDRVLVAPPAGSVAAQRDRYLAYRLGPAIENFGQIVIPTGIIEVTRAPQRGEAATGRVVKMFGEMLQNQRLIPLDSTGAVAMGTPAAVTDGARGKIRWIFTEPVLPSIQHVVIVDLSRNDVRPGDVIELYQPRQAATESRELAIPEVAIARAQVLRVSPFGASAVITWQDQPKIGEGTAARVAAKMP